MEEIIHSVLQEIVKDNQFLTAKYQLMDWVKKHNYVYAIFQKVIQHNICKANRIQFGQYEIFADKYKEHFEKLDLIEILKAQNLVSKDNTTGFIWVLNTCVFLIAEYNFDLVMER